MDSKEYKVLILEDVPTDAELVEAELKKGGMKFVSKRVMDKIDFSKALETFEPDIILSDYNLPQFDGLQALEIAQEKCPDVPFIFVTGAMGDELAIQTLKQGAVDYVLKDKLFHLTPATQRALHESELKMQLKDKMKDFEKLADSVVGRELKMVELKRQMKEIVELNKQTNKA